MDNDLEQRIKHRISEKWQLAGFPESREGDFRAEAEKEVTAEPETYHRLKSDPTITTNNRPTDGPR